MANIEFVHGQESVINALRHQRLVHWHMTQAIASNRRDQRLTASKVSTRLKR